jgi:hypothetical protein
MARSDLKHIQLSMCSSLDAFRVNAASDYPLMKVFIFLANYCASSDSENAFRLFHIVSRCLGKSPNNHKPQCGYESTTTNVQDTIE